MFAEYCGLNRALEADSSEGGPEDTGRPEQSAVLQQRPAPNPAVLHGAYRRPALHNPEALNV